MAVAASAAAATLYAAQTSARPDANRFTPITIVQQGELDEPMAFEVLPNGKVYIIERKGALKVYDPATKVTKVVETLAVNTKYTGADGVAKEAEEGLIGLALDPKFATNHYIYMLYAEPAVTKHVLARWTINEFDELDADSKKVVLEYGTQREVCCHTGGGMVWDKAGNLLLTVGDNTGVNLTSHTDERPGRINWDDQHTAANTNDLRGKMLRIHPEEDGSYTIPAGNLFSPGTPGTRPEIYAMGLRNPWRVSIDSKTGWIYWGEVGPDATEDTANTTRGYDEFNQAKAPGNYGWPYFIGENQAYPVYNYAARRAGAKLDAAKPINASVNNTGLRELPPAVPALISYPYALSAKFPELGTGARSATGGPIYHRADFPNAKRAFPDYYEGKWLAADLSRAMIMAISLTPDGAYAGMERFLPGYKPVEPIDIKFGPDGDLYVLEYGSNWFRKSDNSRLVRIEYNAGNRAPVARASSNVIGGAAPLKVALSAKGSADPDGDALKYSWSVEPEAGGNARTFTTQDVSLTLDKVGVYFATLTVTDPAGKTGEQLVTLVVGNEPPTINIDVPGNRTFFFDDEPLKYAVTVKDKEDGGASALPADRVAFSIDRVAESFDVSWLAQGDTAVDASTRFAVPKALIEHSDCRTCHNVDSKSNGPAWTLVAEKYATDALAQAKLVEKIRGGGKGVWGESNMPAHPGLSVDEARSIINYVMNIKATAISSTVLTGTYAVSAVGAQGASGAAGAQGAAGAGGASTKIVLRAVYTDRGAPNLLAHTVESVAVRRSTSVRAASADDMSGTFIRMEANGGIETVAGRANGYLVFKNIDLTGIREIQIAAQAPAREGFKGGTIEIRLGALVGELVGQVNVGTAGVVGPTASAIQAAGGGGASAGQGAGFPSVALKNATGQRDIYVVFRNFSAKSDEPVVALSELRFVR